MTDDEAILPIDAAENPLRSEWGFRPNDMVVGYSGNLGRAHEIDTLLEAAQILQMEGRQEIRFLVIGGGYLLDRLVNEIASRKLTNFTLKSYQPRDKLHYSLTVADVHWVSLLPSLEGLIVPSKFYGAAASGRPVIFVGTPDGELGEAISGNRCGAVVEQGSGAELAAVIRAYADDPQRRHEHGRNARRLVETEYNRSAIFAQWRDLFTDPPSRLAR